MRQFRLREPELAPSLGHAVCDPSEEPPVLRMGKSLADPLERLVSSPRGCLTHISDLLYIAWMRYSRSIAVALYFALALVWVYWILDRQLFFGSDAAGVVALALVVIAHLALGWVVKRWWAVLLPILPVLLAAPLGYPSANRGEPLPLWLALLFWAPAEVALVAAGIGVQAVRARMRVRA
jgi:hypothetical protein